MKYYRKNRKSKRRGGSNTNSTVNYGSASNWMLDTVGNGKVQYNDTFSQKSPYPANYGNALFAINGTGHHTGGGKTRRKRKGGNLGQVINQAIVPFGLLGLQQSYRRKKGGKKSKRRY
jgi:hypothetical protein